MQRVRMSIPYFKDFGYTAEVVTVAPEYSLVVKDELLIESVPKDIKIHQVKAFDRKWTSKLGLGSLALRSLWFYWRMVNRILAAQQYDLIFFSTTEFPVCVLGSYWKKRFGIPFVIDMQDPWHSNYYQGKPKSQKPPKYWFSYRINKYLEPLAMRHVSGLISVSERYLIDLGSRYVNAANIPVKVITFGAFDRDMVIAKNGNIFSTVLPALEPINLLYVGRGGGDMEKALAVLFKALKKGVTSDPVLFKKLKLYFIGTSYAPAGKGRPTVFPLAQQYGVQDLVREYTDRIGFYQTLELLQKANSLFIPGSDDPRYTASKIYPYLMANKPLLTIFHGESPAVPVLKEYGAEYIIDYESTSAVDRCFDFLAQLAAGKIKAPNYNLEATKKYSAKSMTQIECQFFDSVINQNL